MKRFRLNGVIFQVDDEDADFVRGHRWRATRMQNGATYIVRGRATYLHREIMGDPPGMLVDHRDRDTLNNCRSNLRFCTSSQNSGNRGKPVNGTTSRFKGVSWKNRPNPWRVKVGKAKVGSFPTEEEAARAYDAAAIERWGDFARTNEMLGLYET